MIPLLAAAMLLSSTQAGPLREKLWLHCHGPDAHNRGNGQDFGLDVCGVTPARAAETLGIKNLIVSRYVSGPAPGPEVGTFTEFYQTNGLERFASVMWTFTAENGATSDAERAEAVKLADANPNVLGFVLDDYDPSVPPEILRIDAGRRGLHMVFYTANCGVKALKFYPAFRLVDSVSLWPSSSDANLEQSLAELERHLAAAGTKTTVWLGLYLWAFFDEREPMFAAVERVLRGRPMDARVLRSQLEFAERSLKSGRVEAVIFCGSPVVDPDGPAGEAVRIARDWITTIE